jgi:hypothetical protein
VGPRRSVLPSQSQYSQADNEPALVAENFPSARVIGCDLSPIQPHWTPPNVEFRVEDLEDENRPWTRIYDDADLIHVRALLQTLRKPRQLLERAFE